MYIKRISIRNLFSYKAIDIDISPGLNVVVGKNGSGKSNFVNSLLFVLTDKFSTRDRKMIENNLVQEDSQTIQVSLIIDNAGKRLPYSNDEVSVMRQMTDKDDYFVNGKSVTVSQFSNILQCINLSRSNYYNIVRQGKIARIAQMKDTDVFELLEEVSGVALYEKKKLETQDHIKQAQLEKDEIVKILSDLGDQIKQLHDQKEAFNQLKDIQKQVQLYEIQLSLISAKQFKHQLAEMNAEQSKMHNQLQTYTNSYQQVNDTQFKAIKEIELFGRFVDETEQQLNELNQGLELIKENVKQLQLQEKEANARLKIISIPQEDQKAKETEIDKEILSIQEEQSRIDKELQYFQILQTDDPVKRFKEEVTTLQKSLEGYQKEYNNVQFKISQLNKELNQMKSSQNSNINVQSLQEELKKQETILLNLRKKLETSSLDDMELQRKKTMLQQQLCKLQNESDIECNQLDKQMRDIYTTSILKIMEYAEQRQLTIYGVFAQLMNVKQKRLLPLIETASGPRLFSLIVPDTQTAKAIIDFNREQQGSVLRIYPLDLIDDRVHQFETPKDTINLQEQITLTGDFPHKKSLIAKVVGKWVAVKDYQAALDISQQFEINCITQDNEVVYADSFLTKVGATRVQQSKALQLQKILAMNDQIRQLSKVDKEMDIKIEEDAHSLLEIQREIQQHKNIQSGIYQQLQSQDVKALEKKQNEIDSLEQLARQLDIPIQDTKTQINEIQQKLKNPKQIKKMSGQNIDTIQQLIKEKQELSIRLTDLMKQKNETKLARHKKIDQSKIQSLKQEHNDMQQQLEQLQTQLKGKIKYQQDLADQLKDQRQQLKNAMKEKETCKQELRNLEMNMESIKNAQTDLEKQIQSCMDMIEQVEKEKKLMDAFSDIDELESRNQIIKKIKELKQKFNQKFTQKDQSLFDKLNDIENKFTEYQKKFENLKQVQADFDHLCEMMDQKAENLLSDQLFKKFAEYFRHYFLQIVTTGDCSVKLIKGIKKNSKKNWGVDIKISFKSKELQNWTSFSSGEKTIVAFVILIALQQCDPAPFYILDEFDAALDDNYRGQVAQILLQLSKQSQYLVITFRPELLNLNSDDVSYYKVAHHNQQSSVVKTTQQEAQKILKA